MRRLLTFVAVTCVSLGFLGAGGATAASPPNIPPTAAFGNACYGQRATHACDKQAILNINSARATEGLGPIALPANYKSLTLIQKEVAVSNAERTARGLSKLPAKLAWAKLAKTGAVNNTDPIGPSGRGWGSIWAGGLGDPLAADYLWVYWDGPGSPNGDCVNPGDSGCFGHRNNILGPFWTAMGAGKAPGSLAQLFVQ
ncbi:MAG TPA: hypothetical protein VH914_12925 [Acidimicrobiia bacterium]|jgi:hypothetical protein|nr:hypothetical protein [Acidimicrobiia bacterium]